MIVIQGVVAGCVVGEGDAFHFVVERWKHGRELTRCRVGGDVDELRVAVVAFGSCTTVRGTLDFLCGTLYGKTGSAEVAHSVVVNDVVERALCLAAQAEFQGSLANAVLTAGKAYGLILIGISAVDTSGDVHQRRVREVANLCLHEVVGLSLFQGEGGQSVSVLPGLDTVVADGYIDGVLTVGVAVDASILALCEGAVNLELYAVDRDVRVQIGHLAGQRERRVVGEVVAVQGQ